MIVRKVSELNNFEIEGLLPALFYAAISEGRGISRQVNDPSDIKKYVQSLVEHPAVSFTNVTDRFALMNNLVRTTLIKTSNRGRGAKKAEKIAAIAPYSILSHKTGLPMPSSYMRNVDKFLYNIMLKNAGKQEAIILRLKDVFGKGIQLGTFPLYHSQYDGATPVNILTRISIAFLDGFKPISAKANQPEKRVSPACPHFAEEIGIDVLRYMNEYHQLMQTEAFTYYFHSLLNFELFVYTLKLVHGANNLVSQPDTTPSVFLNEPNDSPSLPLIYLDFTQIKNGASYEMAKRCVLRDIDAYLRFVYSNLYLRQLSRYVKSMKRGSRNADIEQLMEGETNGAGYILGLSKLRQDDSLWRDIEASAHRDEELIRIENQNEDDKDNTDLSWLDEIADFGQNDFERVIYLLTEAQQKHTNSNYITWYWQTGGIRKPYGLLAGDVKSRYSWRYEPTNDLLATLVQVAAVRLNDKNAIQPIRLIDFLAFLKNRFGIIIDEPPELTIGTEYQAAARENVLALQYRLRQMGLFLDLSDDFTEQYIIPPYQTVKKA